MIAESGNYTLEAFVFAASLLMMLAIFANKASARIGLPSLLLFLGLGMAAGSEGPGGIVFSNPEFAYAIGSLALALIIFDGGLRTSWKSVRPILAPGISLSFVGVVVTALVTGIFAHYALNLEWVESILLGAIISSTDAAAVFSILGSQNLALKGRVKQVLEFEAGSNDPSAIFLTLGLLGLVVAPASQMETSWFPFIKLLLSQIIFGLLFGYAGGRAMKWITNRSGFGSEGLYNVLALVLAFLVFSGTALLGGSGFLAVYVAGLVVGNSGVLHKESIMRFHDALAWLAQIGLFLTLGLLVFPSQLVPLWGQGLLLAGFLTFVARPLSVLIAVPTKIFSWRERTFVSWVGLRGGAPIILATLPFTVDFPNAAYFFNLVFIVVIVSVLVQGTSIPWVARKLDIIEPIPDEPAPKREMGILPEGFIATEILVEAEAPAIGKRLVEIGLPSGVFLTSLKRDGRYLIPQGSTIFNESDEIRALVQPRNLEIIQSIFAAPDI